MGQGVTSLATNAKRPASGPPFVVGAANNGLSVDPVSGAIVLGNDIGSTLAILLSTREIPNIGNTRATIFYGNGNIRLDQPGTADTAQTLQIGGNMLLNSMVLATNGNNFFVNQLVAGVPVGLSVLASGNIGIGAAIFAALTSGTRNVAIGINSMNAATVAEANVALCSNSLQRITAGTGNIAIGNDALNMLTTGIDNIQIGRNSPGTGITTGLENTCIGVNTNITGNLTTGNQNILIGYNVDAPTNANGNINIGNLFYGLGAIGQNLNPVGKAGILTNNPLESLHVKGTALVQVPGNLALYVAASEQNIIIQNPTRTQDCGYFGRDSGTAGIIIQSLFADISLVPLTDVRVTTGFLRIAGSAASTFRWAANTTAPALTATPVFTSFYGGNTNALGDPVDWILVNVAGVSRKIPVY